MEAIKIDAEDVNDRWLFHLRKWDKDRGIIKGFNDIVNDIRIVKGGPGKGLL